MSNFTIYGLATKEDKEQGIIKVGFVDLDRQSVDDRINQLNSYSPNQSRFERRIDDFNSKTFSDGPVHKFLDSKGYKRIKGSEYYFITPVELETELNLMIGNRQFLNTKRFDNMLRFSQQTAIDTLTTAMSSYRDLLLAACPRWGKTGPSLLLVEEALRQTGKRIVIYTSGKLDTKASVISHVEQKFSWDFDLYVVNRDEKIKDPTQGKWLIYASIQDLADLRSGALKSKFDFLDIDEVALIIFDEAHSHLLTDRTKKWFDHINADWQLYISGTAFQLIEEDLFKRGAPNTYFYDIIDENRDVKAGIIDRIDVPKLKYFIVNDDYVKGSNLSSWREIFDEDPELLEKIVKSWFEQFSRPSSLHLNGVNNRSIRNAVIVCPPEIKYCKQMWQLLDNIKKTYGVSIRAIMASGENWDENGDDCDDWYSRYNDLASDNSAHHNFLITLGRGLQAVDYPDVEAVIMLSDGESPAQYIQSAFRSKTGNGTKSEGYVIDYKRDRVLKLIHQQAEVHIDDNNDIEHDATKYNELYSEFEVYEQDVHGQPSHINFFFEDVISLFNKGDYSDRVGDWILKDALSDVVLKQISKYFNNQANIKSTNKRASAKGNAKKLTHIKTSRGTKQATKIQIDNYQIMKANIATAIYYMPAFLSITGHIVQSLKDFEHVLRQFEEDFETMTTISADFIDAIIYNDIINKKTWTKLLVEAQAKAEKMLIEVPIQDGDSRPVSKELADKMLNILGNVDNCLVIGGGWNLMPDTEVTYIDTNKAMCKVIEKNYDVNVIYTEDILGELTNMNFKALIMNPPYGNLHLPILKKCVEEIVDIDNGGKIVSLQPVRWLQDPLWKIKQKTDMKKMQPVIESKLNSVEILSEKEATDLFDATFTMKLGIFELKKNGKMNYTDLIEHQDIFNKVMTKNNFAKVVPFDNQKYFVPIRTIMAQSERKTIRPNMYNYGRIWLKYLVNGKTPDGLTIDEAMNNNPHITMGSGKQVGVKMRSKVAAKNYYDSFGTNFIKFWCKITCLDVNIQTSIIPFLDDYSEQWTDDKFYKYFEITKAEQKIIEKTMEIYK